MSKRWLFQETPSNPDLEPQKLNISKCIAVLLGQRGISTFDAAKKFLNPQISDLPDPLLYSDMLAAVTRIREAIAKEQEITTG